MGFFLPVLLFAGGSTEKIWFRLAQLMAAAGHAVTVVSLRCPALPDVASTGSLTHLRVSGMVHTTKLSLNLVLDFIRGPAVARAISRYSCGHASDCL